MTGEAALKLSKEQLRIMFRRGLFSRQAVASFLIVLAIPLWVPPAAYLFLKSLRFDPHGIIAWSFVVIVATVSICNLVWFFSKIIRRGNELRPLRVAALAEDEQAREAYFALRTAPLHFHQKFFAWTGLHLLIPALVALVVGSSLQGGEFGVRDQGKLRPSTREESLNLMMKHWEEKGIYSLLRS